MDGWREDRLEVFEFHRSFLVADVLVYRSLLERFLERPGRLTSFFYHFRPLRRVRGTAIPVHLGGLLHLLVQQLLLHVLLGVQHSFYHFLSLLRLLLVPRVDKLDSEELLERVFLLVVGLLLVGENLEELDNEVGTDQAAFFFVIEQDCSYFTDVEFLQNFNSVGQLGTYLPVAELVVLNTLLALLANEESALEHDGDERTGVHISVFVNYEALNHVLDSVRSEPSAGPFHRVRHLAIRKRGRLHNLRPIWRLAILPSVIRRTQIYGLVSALLVFLFLGNLLLSEEGLFVE